jgi:hypothetical protein
MLVVFGVLYHLGSNCTVVIFGIQWNPKEINEDNLGDTFRQTEISVISENELW